MHLGYNAVELPVNTQIGTVAEINRLRWGTQAVIHHHTEPSQQTPTMEDQCDDQSDVQPDVHVVPVADGD